MGAKRVILSGVLIAKTGDHQIIESHLPAHIRLTRSETGCLAFDVARDADDPSLYMVEEMFADRAAFEAHQSRVKASAWGRATAHMQRDYIIKEQGV